MRRSGQVVTCFFGDGATSRGPLHEALNMAAVFKLPVLFVVILGPAVIKVMALH